MPINIPDSLPAKAILESENIFVMTRERAFKQDIRPLKIVLLNLMPTKIQTETQLLRLIGNTPIQIDIDLLHMATHRSKNTPSEHMLAFYKAFDDIKDKRYDGMIITGAPVELLDFEQVDYWPELCGIMEWSKSNVFSTFHICWGAQAGLYHHFGIPKYPLAKKMFGIFPHRCLMQNHKLFFGSDDIFYAPHSRHTEVRRNDIEKSGDLLILSESDISGVYIVAGKDNRQFFVTGHSEYDLMTLNSEYVRDRDKGLTIDVPYNYYPGDDPENTPIFTWKSHASLLFANWLNYFVYQATPYDLTAL